MSPPTYGSTTPASIALVLVLVTSTAASCTDNDSGVGDASSPATSSAAPGPTTPPDADQLEAEIASYIELIGAEEVLGSVVVASGDEIVLEQYYSGGAETYWDVQSVTKSVVSILVGIALDEGHLESIDEPLKALLPDEADLMSRDVARTTLRELLTMTGGFPAGGESPPTFTQQPNWVAAVLQHPERAPGGSFHYSNGTSHVLAAILQEAVGTSALDYARSRLFDPLGIRTRPALEAWDPDLSQDDFFAAFEAAGFAWPMDPQGVNMGWWGLKLRPQDMVALGQLLLAGGRWDGEQLVPRAWVDEATSPHVEAGGDADGYGYQWWIASPDGDEAFLAVGFGGQVIEVVPDRELVVVTTTRVSLDDPAERGIGTGTLTEVIEQAVVAQFPDD